MPNRLLPILLLALAFAACDQTETPPGAPTEIGFSPTTTCSEIYGAASLAEESDRVAFLRTIALRPTLTPTEQAYLACATLKHLETDPGRIAVLTTLINNPAFAEEARRYILENLLSLLEEPNRVLLLQKLLDHPATAPASAPTTSAG